MVEDFALAGLGLWDEAVVKHIENILADLLELGLDLLTVIADDANVLVCAFGLLLLLDARDDSPGRAARADHVLVGHGKEVALVDGKLTAELHHGLVSVRGRRGEGGAMAAAAAGRLLSAREAYQEGVPLQLPIERVSLGHSTHTYASFIWHTFMYPTISALQISIRLNVSRASS